MVNVLGYAGLHMPVVILVSGFSDELHHLQHPCEGMAC